MTTIDPLPPPDPSLMGTEYGPSDFGHWVDTAEAGFIIILTVPFLVILAPFAAVAWVVGRLTRRWWDKP